METRAITPAPEPDDQGRHPSASQAAGAAPRRLPGPRVSLTRQIRPGDTAAPRADPEPATALAYSPPTPGGQLPRSRSPESEGPDAGARGTAHRAPEPAGREPVDGDPVDPEPEDLEPDDWEPVGGEPVDWEPVGEEPVGGEPGRFGSDPDADDGTALSDPSPSGTVPTGNRSYESPLPDDQPSAGSLLLPIETVVDDRVLWTEPADLPRPAVLTAWWPDLDTELTDVESPDDSGIRTLTADLGLSDPLARIVGRGQLDSGSPRLASGDVLAQQYEVLGPIGHGGLGWVYLARDHKLNRRFVVLKGLKDVSDPNQRAVARAEKRHLAETSHANLVRVYNVVEDDETDYIVMEHLRGRSLADELSEAPTRSLPPHRALTFTIEVLTAVGYLHRRGMLHCDIKPANVMHVEDGVKVIDLGAVVRLDEQHSTIYGSWGYQAPEARSGKLSIQSDLYTVGRTLLRLVADIPGFDDDYAGRLPDPVGLDGISGFDSLYRFLRKACHVDPTRRFETAENMAVQALGVRREVVAVLRQLREAADTRHAPSRRTGLDGLVPAELALGSARFGPPAQVTNRPSWRDLPEPSLGGLAVTRELGRARALIAQGRFRSALKLLDDVSVEHAGEWRAAWLRGACFLAPGEQHDAKRAVAAFNTVYGEVPGELAPKLALGYACERAGWDEMAEYFYAVCARTDAAYVAPAAFGLARLSAARRAAREAAGDVAGAQSELARTERALRLVPRTSIAWAAAAGKRADYLADGSRDPRGLALALDLIGDSALTPLEAARLRLRLFERAWRLLADEAGPTDRRDRIGTGPGTTPGSTAGRTVEDQSEIHLDGYPFDRIGIARGLEDSLRRLAVLVGDLGERNDLIDRANRVRPRSLF